MRDAAAGMAEVLELAERTEKLHEAAGLAVLERLGAFLGRNVAPAEQRGLRRPARPVEAQAGWMWRPVGECLPITLLRALLRMNSTGMRSRELFERVLFLNVDVHYASVAFAAQRLEARRLIRREGTGVGR